MVASPEATSRICDVLMKHLDWLLGPEEWTALARDLEAGAADDSVSQTIRRIADELERRGKVKPR